MCIMSVLYCALCGACRLHMQCGVCMSVHVRVCVGVCVYMCVCMRVCD